MQVKPYNVYVTVAYPPDTDTPGFAEENKTKASIPLCALFPVCINRKSPFLFSVIPPFSQKIEFLSVYMLAEAFELSGAFVWNLGGCGPIFKDYNSC